MHHATRHRHIDPYVLEHVIQPRFWILAAFLIAFWIWTIAAASQYHPSHASPNTKQTTFLAGKNNTSSKGPQPYTIDNYRKEDAREASYSPRFILWLRPHLKTSLHEIIAIFVYVGILYLQLLEGYWIIVTFTRIDMRAFYYMWPISAPNWVHSVYAWSLIVSLGIEIGVLGLLGVMVLFQATCIAELTMVKNYRAGTRL
jgi:hypothetical protein